jgi:hypothetical protein
VPHKARAPMGAVESKSRTKVLPLVALKYFLQSPSRLSEDQASRCLSLDRLTGQAVSLSLP